MGEFSSPDYRWPQNGEPIRVGATLPRLRANISDKNGSVDYSDPGNTVTFTAYPLSGGAVKVNAASATGANGYLEYAWVAADVDTAGDFYGYFTVTSSSGTQHIPRGRRIVYKITSDS